MSEELYGGPALERDAGFTPMETPEPSEPKDIGGDSSSLRDAANELTEGREIRRGEIPQDWDEVSYKKVGKDGQPTHERSDPKETIKLERGAKDLAAYREAQAKAEEQEAIEAIRRDTDALRAGQKNANNQPQQFSPEQQQAQAALNQAYQQSPSAHGYSQIDQQLVEQARNPQFQQNVKYTQHAIAQRMQDLDTKISEAYSRGEPWQELGAEYQQLVQAHEQIGFVERAQLAMAAGMSPKVATAVADREVLEWITKGTDGIKAAYDEALQKHQQDAEDVLHFAIKAFTYGLPELMGCKTQQEISAVIDTIKMNNPARGQAIGNWWQLAHQAADHAVAVREEIARAKNAKFQEWAKQEDLAFRTREPEFMSPQTQKAVAFEAFSYLESKGLSKDEVIRLHDSDPLFRSAAGQSVLWDALRYQRLQQAKATLPNKRVPPDPVHVLKPGSSEDRIDADRSEKLPGSMNVREAANILNNRRQKRR